MDMRNCVAIIVAGIAFLGTITGVIIQVRSNKKLQKKLKKRDKKLALQLQGNDYEQEYFKRILDQRFEVLEEIHCFLSMIDKDDTSIFDSNKKIKELILKNDALINHYNIWLLPYAKHILRWIKMTLESISTINKSKNNKKIKNQKKIPYYYEMKSAIGAFSKESKNDYLNSSNIKKVKEKIIDTVNYENKISYFGFLSDELNKAGILNWSLDIVKEINGNEFQVCSHISTKLYLLLPSVRISCYEMDNVIQGSPVDIQKYDYEISLPSEDDIYLYNNIDDLLIAKKGKVITEQIYKQLENKKDQNLQKCIGDYNVNDYYWKIRWRLDIIQNKYIEAYRNFTDKNKNKKIQTTIKRGFESYALELQSKKKKNDIAINKENTNE